GDNAYLGYNNLDLIGIKQIEFLVQATPNSGDAGGTIEVHLDSPNGKLIGHTAMIESKAIDFARIMENLGGKPKGRKGAVPKVDTAKKREAPPIDFDAFQKLMSTHAVASIDTIEGMHSVYFVFKNSRAEAKQPLMQVVQIEFQNKAATNMVGM